VLFGFIVLHTYCIAQLLYCTLTVLHNYCIAHILYCTHTVLHNYCIAHLLYCTLTVLHTYCIAQLLYCTITVLHNYCIAQLLYCTLTVLHTCCIAHLLIGILFDNRGVFIKVHSNVVPLEATLMQFCMNALNAYTCHDFTWMKMENVISWFWTKWYVNDSWEITAVSRNWVCVNLLCIVFATCFGFLKKNQNMLLYNVQ